MLIIFDVYKNQHIILRDLFLNEVCYHLLHLNFKLQLVV